MLGRHQLVRFPIDNAAVLEDVAAIAGDRPRQACHVFHGVKLRLIREAHGARMLKGKIRAVHEARGSPRRRATSTSCSISFTCLVSQV